MDEIFIQVTNWDKHQARKDVKCPSWFKLNHFIFDDPKMYSLDAEAFRFWIFLLCLSSKANKEGESPLTYDYAHRVLGISSTAYKSIIKKLQSKKMVTIRTIRGRYADVRDMALREDKIREEERREEKKARERAVSQPPLLEIWNKNSGALPKAKGTAASRSKLCAARWAENPSTEYWSEIVSRLASSSFCNGDNDRGWKATIDFLLQPDTQHKVLEGKYDKATPKKTNVLSMEELSAIYSSQESAV